MELKELIQRQRDFDKKHGWDWYAVQDHEKLLEVLQYEVIALTGEVGEIANKLKKYLRDDAASLGHPESISEQLTPEIVDALIYLLKIASTLDIDLEAAYLEKMEANLRRFARYEQINSSD